MPNLVKELKVEVGFLYRWSTVGEDPPCATTVELKNPLRVGLSIKSDGGSKCWALHLTQNIKNPILTTMEYNFCKTEAPEL